MPTRDGPGLFLEDLTWPEAKARFDGGAVVVVPIGAAAKEHGPHLPLGGWPARVTFTGDPAAGADYSRSRGCG